MKFLKDTSFENGRNYIGASDIATLAGLNKKYNQTPLTLWEVLTKRTAQWTGNESTEWGHLLEGLILKKAIEKLDYKDHAEKFYIDKIKGKNNDQYWSKIRSRTKNILRSKDISEIDEDLLPDPKELINNYTYHERIEILEDTPKNKRK